MNEALNREMIVKAQALILSNQVNTAIEILLELLQIYPNHPQVLELIAFISNEGAASPRSTKGAIDVTNPYNIFMVWGHRCH